MSKIKLNLEYYSGRDIYSDGEIEDELYEITLNNNCYDDIVFNDNRWPILYHLSSIRHNIISWYPFKKDCSILEIGAGCGAITGALCDKAKEVVAVDLSKRRSEINANRNKNRDNLEIIVGNLSDIKFERQFDYITLIGVWEYAIKFKNSNDPYLDFLKDIKRLLKPDGVLLLAVENRYGLKYFSGSKEDHVGSYFSGINGYIGIDNVRTFDKRQVSKYLKDAGFSKLSYYYPFPDYKTPYQIFSDKQKPKYNQLESRTITFDRVRLENFNERLVFNDLISNDMFGYFANSFLIECSNIDTDVNILYVKHNSKRLPKYQITTTIIEEDEKKVVVKSPIYSYGIDHIKDIFDNYTKLNQSRSQRFSVIDTKFKEGKLYLKYTDDILLSEYLIRLINNGKKNEVFKKLEEVYNILVSNSEDNSAFYICDKMKEVFGKHAEELSIFRHKHRYITLPNLDFNFENITVLSNGKYEVIDFEWVFDFLLPIEFIFYRCIRLFFSKYGEEIGNYITNKEIYNYFNITEEEIQLFERLNNEFFIYVHGKNAPYCYFQYLKKCVNLNHYINERNALKKNNKKLKQELKVCKAIINEESKKLIEKNAKFAKEQEKFAEVRNDLIKRIEDLERQNEQLKQRIGLLNSEQEKIKEENNRLVNEINRIKNSRSWKVIQFLSSIKYRRKKFR